ncbi:hypothetical protein BsWGS_15476 [Bradybaena similaris]
MMKSQPHWAVSALTCIVITFSSLAVRAQPPGYYPQPGRETACLNFAIDFFNRGSMRPMRAGPLRLDNATMEVLRYSGNQPIELWYRFLGVFLMDTPCQNTENNNGATPYVCPVVNDMMAGGSVPWNSTCNFKVWFASGLRMRDMFKMIYMVCY